jgi:hypothetical protein
LGAGRGVDGALSCANDGAAANRAIAAAKVDANFMGAGSGARKESTQLLSNDAS